MTGRNVDPPPPVARVGRRGFLAAAGLTGLAAAFGVWAGGRTSTSGSTAASPAGSSWAAHSSLATTSRTGAPGDQTEGESVGGEGQAATAGPGGTLANYQAAVQALAGGTAPAEVPFLSAFIAGPLEPLTPITAYRQLLATSYVTGLYLEYISAQLDTIVARARDHAQDRAATLAWNGGDASEAAVLAFRRTGDTRFLDAFVAYFDEVLRLRDSELGIKDVFHGRPIAAWGDEQLGHGRWIAHVTLAARVCYPATEFARLTLGDTGLSRYHQRAEQYIAKSERAIAEFDSDYQAVPGEGVSYYYRPTTGRSEPVNHVHQVGNVLLNLQDLTGNARYLNRAAEIAEVFVRSVSYDDRGYPYWRYFPYFNLAGSHERAEKIWKAAVTAPFVYRAAEFGVVDRSLPKAIARTFVDNIVRDGEMNRYIDPEEFVPVTEGDEWASRVNALVNWLEFAPLRPKIHGLIVDVLTTHRNGFFAGGWLAFASRSLGYAYCLGGGQPGNLAADSLK